LSELIAALFNSSLRQEYFPKIWKSAEVVPVPKINPHRTVETDLQPIYLLPVLAKVFEGFVRRWLMNSLLPMFDDFQFGLFDLAFHSTCADINNA